MKFIDFEKLAALFLKYWDKFLIDGVSYTLALAARELVRIAIEMLRPQADLRHDVQRPRHPLVLVADMVNRQHFHQHVTNTLPRVQRRVRVLEHNLHIPAERQHFLLAQVGDVLIE